MSKQIEAKLKGEPVTSPHSAAVTLFTQYDTARARALKPIKAASLQRIEVMLKTSAAKDMKVILELAKAREEIESEIIPLAGASSGAPTLPAILHNTEWTWERPGVSESISFAKDGTFEQTVFRGTWERLSDYDVQLLYGKTGQERKVVLRFNKAFTSLSIIEGDTASGPTTGTLKRAVTAPQVGGKMPMKWDYYSDPSMQVINGELVLNADGTLTLYGPPGTKAATPGTWQATGKRDIINVTLIRQPPESCVLRIKGSLATLERPIGTRYLKSK